MKKTFAVILTAMLVVLLALALVGCSGVSSDADWDKAMETYLTADSITLKITDDVWIWKSIIFDNHYKKKSTVSFDAKKGIVTIICKNSGNDLSGIHAKTEDRYYYVLEETNVIEYYCRVSEYRNEWKNRETHEFDTVELAMEYLRSLYLNYLDRDDVPYVPFTEYTYDDFNSTTLLGKRTYEKTVNGETFNYTLGFSGGKVTKCDYKFKHTKDSSHRKTSISISYSAKVTLPNDLPTGQEDIME